jgi:hypothetical protein
MDSLQVSERGEVKLKEAGNNIFHFCRQHRKRGWCRYYCQKQIYSKKWKVDGFSFFGINLFLAIIPTPPPFSMLSTKMENIITSFF